MACGRLAEAATREGQSHVGYLEALLAAEMEERESRAISRLLHEARLPPSALTGTDPLLLTGIDPASAQRFVVSRRDQAISDLP